MQSRLGYGDRHGDGDGDGGLEIRLWSRGKGKGREGIDGSLVD